MSAQSVSLNQAAALGAAESASPVARLIKWIRGEISARRTAAILSTLSDDELKDIGLTRFDIHSFARRLRQF